MVAAVARASRSFALGCACAAFALCGLAVAARPSAAVARPLATGVTNLEDGEPLAFQQVRDTGARFIRIGLSWENIAPKAQPTNWQPGNPADPNYSWGHIDELVSRAVEAGLTPMLQLGSVPPWAQRCETPSVLPWATCDPDPTVLATFASAAAQHFNGGTPGAPRVRYWQGLNEPNLSIFFFPQFNTAGKPLSPSLYRTLLNSFYAAIKSVHRSNLVVSAGLGPIAVPPWTMGPMRFARLMLCMTGAKHPHPTAGRCGGGVHFDIFAIHPYTTGGPTHKGKVNDVELGDLPKLHRLLRAADRAGRIKGAFRHTPLWVTEFSWDSKPPDPGGLLMKIETRWVAEALFHSWKAGVSNFFWYSLQDGARDPDQPFSATLEAGLYFRGATIAENRPKDALYAFRFPFVAYPTKRGLSYWGRTPTSGSGKVAVQIWRNGHWRTVSNPHADKDGIFSGIARTGYGRGKHGAARAVYARQSAPPFSMKPVPDFRQSPFG